MKKISIIIVAFLLVLFAIMGTGLYFLSSLVTENFLVQQIESTFNCRAEIRKVNLSLFSIFSSLVVEDIKLAPRDLVADKGTALKDREPIKDYQIGIKKIELQLSLLPLLEKRFELKKFLIHEPEVSMVLYKNGDNNLASLLQTPKVVDGKLNPALEEKQKSSSDKEKETDPSGKESDKDKEEKFSIKKLPLSAKLERIGISKGTVRVLVEETSQKLLLANWTIMISFIDINPQDLKNHNSVDLSSSFALSVKGKSGESAKILFGTEGKVVPFTVETGYVNPVVNYNAYLKKGTYIAASTIADALKSQIPLFQELKMAPKSLEQEVTLQKDVHFKMQYSHGTITLKEKVELPFGAYDFRFQAESWLQITNNAHFFNSAIVFSKDESQKVTTAVDAFIAKNAKDPNIDKKAIRDKLLATVVKDARLFLEFKSKGNLASPDLELLSNIPSFSELLQGVVLDVLKNKLGDEIKKKIPGGLDKLF
ncbi:MAG: AsmA family protein [Spirochaetota bacterium]